MTTWKIEHGFYGCETGCCGYRLTEDGDDSGYYFWDSWTFDHVRYDDDAVTDEELIEFAREQFPEHIKPDDLVVVGEWRTCRIP